LPREVIAKLFRSRRGVQLIVFFAVIREILKRKIYRADKGFFCPMKTKGRVGNAGEVGGEL